MVIERLKLKENVITETNCRELKNLLFGCFVQKPKGFFIKPILVLKLYKDNLEFSFSFLDNSVFSCVQTIS